MARYPTFEEYNKSGRYDDGIKHCDELLARSPNDVQVLTVKLRLLSSSGQDSASVLEKLASVSPPIQDIDDIVAIEDAVNESLKDFWPVPNSAGPLVAKLWDAAAKASTSMQHRLDIQSLRLSRAIIESRLLDAQQALIQLKALQPKNRVIYMAHAAFTQLLSSGKEDLQARLALGLARKAVKEKFDEDKALDCRVPGQIFALQGADEDLKAIQGRSFHGSKQVFEALRSSSGSEANGTVTMVDVPEPGSVPSSQWMSAEVSNLKHQFAMLVESQASANAVKQFTINAIRLFHTATANLTSNSRRGPADACFLAISALVRLWEQTGQLNYLLHAAYLADSLLKFDTHIHEARLILVYLYMRLGLGSLAIQLFESLRVKEVQHDTVGHALFTRLPVIHPQTVSLGHTKKDGSFDPEQRMQQALAVYTRCEARLSETEAEVLNHGQTGMIFDLHELRRSLTGSLTQRLIILERRRSGRLLGAQSSSAKSKSKDEQDVDLMWPRKTANWLTVKDNRDFSATFYHGYNVERALQSQNGAVPGRLWLALTLAADSAWSLATSRTVLVTDPEELLKQIDEMLASAGDDLRDTGMIGTELLAYSLTASTLRMMLDFNASSDSNGSFDTQAHLAKLSTAMDALNTSALCDEVASSTDISAWDRLPDAYLIIDALRILHAALQHVGQAGESDKDSPLSTITSNSFSRAFSDAATKQVTRIKPNSVRAHLEQDADLRLVNKSLSDDQQLRWFCEDVSQSAQDAWAGLMKMKIV